MSPWVGKAMDRKAARRRQQAMLSEWDRHKCDMFSPGTPANGGCQGDGHCLRSQCVLHEEANYDPDKATRFHAVEKRQPFGTCGGSFHYAKRIVPLIPEHATYVEPFAGAAAVLYAKEPSAKEVIADLDDDVVFLHRSIKSMTAETVEKLRRFEWTCTKESFEKARDLTPRGDLVRFYKLVFVRTHARDCRPDGTHPARDHLGSTTNPAKFLGAAERLKDVTILKQDYRKTVERFDGPETFFFLDPPYPGEWYDKDAAVDVDEFVEVLAKIRGRFIAVLNPTPENVAAFRRVGHVFRLKVREASGRGGAKQAMRLFCANFKIANRHRIPARPYARGREVRSKI